MIDTSTNYWLNISNARRFYRQTANKHAATAFSLVSAGATLSSTSTDSFFTALIAICITSISSRASKI